MYDDQHKKLAGGKKGKKASVTGGGLTEGTKSKSSDWVCHMFGPDGPTWRPAEGKVPNVFWRFCQFVFFGNHWAKEKEAPFKHVSK